MNHFNLTLIFLINCVVLTDSVGRQSSSGPDVGSITQFSQVVNQCFSQWDLNGDGTLSKDEIDAAVANPTFHGEAAAAIAAIEKVTRGNKYTLPPITKNFLVASPMREPSTFDEQNDFVDDVSKQEKFNHAPAFQPRYLAALRKIRQTSRELFPESLPSFEATHQGSLGDCPFVSTVGAIVYRNPAQLKAMFSQNVDGSITVSLGDGRKPKIAHVTDADIAIWSSAGSNGLWLTVLEKAYRHVLLKIEHPNKQSKLDIYDKFGASVKTIEILDGHQTRNFPLKGLRPDSMDMASLRRELTAAERDKRLVKAATGAARKIPGITPDHAYAILGFEKNTDAVKVWNPHGNNFTPKGSDGLQNGYTTKSGIFEAPLKELPHIFTDLSFETEAPNRN